MKVAVAASGNTLDAPADPRFGRCPYYVIVDSDTMEYEAIENAATMQGSGAGIAAAQLVANSGAEAVIAGNFGPNAFQALAAGGIQLYAGATGTVRDAVEALKAGRLQSLNGPSVQSHFGIGAGGGAATAGPGAGAGMGAGMGRGMGMGGGMGRGMGRGMGMGGGMGGGGFAWQPQQPPVPPPPPGPPPAGEMWGPGAEPSKNVQLQMLRGQAQMIQAQLEWINEQIRRLEQENKP